MVFRHVLSLIVCVMLQSWIIILRLTSLFFIFMCVSQPKCGEEESAYHFLGRCSAIMMARTARYSILGSYLMHIMELQQVQPYTLLKFAKVSKRFI